MTAEAPPGPFRVVTSCDPPLSPGWGAVGFLYHDNTGAAGILSAEGIARVHAFALQVAAEEAEARNASGAAPAP